MKKEINHIFLVIAMIWLGMANSLSALADDSSTTTTIANVTLPVGESNTYSPNGSKFMAKDANGNTDIPVDFSKQDIIVKFNTTNCDAKNITLQNVLSIGKDIKEWEGRNLHCYYTPKNLLPTSDGNNNIPNRLRIAYVDKYGGWAAANVDFEGDEVTIKLTTNGLYVNDKEVSIGNTMNSDNLKTLLTQSTLQIGGCQGTTPSYATYSQMELKYKPGATEENYKGWPWEANYAPNGSKFFCTQDIDFMTQSLDATIDLSGCEDGNNENILSIGNCIKDFHNQTDGNENYNLHFYFKKNGSTGTLSVCYLQNVSSGDDSKDASVSGIDTSTPLHLVVSREGIYVNDQWISKFHGHIKTSTTYNVSDLCTLLDLGTYQIGSLEGNTRSHAKYTAVNIVSNPNTTTINNLPWSNFQAKNSKFYASTSIDFNTQSLVADIDLSGCRSDNNDETILNIGNDVSTWGDMGLYNIHIYYNKAKSTKQLEVNYLKNGGSEDKRTKKYWTINDGSLKLKLSKEGLSVNGDIIDDFNATALSDLLGLSMIQVGSAKGDQNSHALYNVYVEGDAEKVFHKDWIANEQKFEDHKEVAHATYIPYANTGDMKKDAGFYDTPWTESQSSLIKNLNTVNGDEWKFCYVKGTTSGPGESDFFAKDFKETSDWKTIRVPLSWEMAGYGRPVYTNIGYPFKYTPPQATVSNSGNKESDNNATGFYRRNFTINDTWKDKRIFLHFDGVYSAAVVWVDGKYVGYSQGSNNDAEFDITEALDKTSDGNSILTGEAEANIHQLSVRVYRWCDGSYLEGQDMWHLSGIHRDVYLVAKPKVFVSDAVITAKNLSDDESSLSDDATSGNLYVTLTIDNRDLAADVSKTFTVTLSDKDGKTIGNPQQVTYESGSTPTNTEVTYRVEFTGLTGLHPWTAEIPYLYNVCVSQSDGKGSLANEEMAFNTKYGFRKITKDTKLVYINGKRVFFKGVNTQDTHPEYGRAIDMETMMKDLTMMKRANINTVRTSHYPRQAKMYAMMDALGFYVMDEADVECHHSWINTKDHITSKESWAPQYVDRNERMVKRDRNHPCVIFWSLGNESGDGVCFEKAYNAVKALDSERPIHYEGTFNSGYSNGANTNTNEHSDLFSDMYPSTDEIGKKKDGANTYGMPYFICEYCHAMGQSLGLLKENWDIVKGSSAIIGGCIWDWVDQAIYKTESGTGVVADKQDAQGFHNWTAGYDYNQSSGNQPYQGNFMDNGIVTPDRRWTAKLTEVKKVYQDVDFSLSQYDNGKKPVIVTVSNNSPFTTLTSENYQMVGKLLKNGKLAEVIDVPMTDIAPNASRDLTLNINSNIDTSDGNEYLLNVEFCLKNATDWADAGYCIADAQFSLTGEAGAISTPSLATKTVTESSLKVDGNTVSGTDEAGKKFQIAFGTDGKMAEWTYDGKSLLHSTSDDNTLATGAAPDFNSMFNIENNMKTSSIQVNTSTTEITSGTGFTLANGKATMSVKGTATNCEYVIDYTIYPDATMDLHVTFTPTYSNSGTHNTRRLGLGMQFASGFENVEFYARGPWSNYLDRKNGCYLGRYTTTVDDMVEELVRPQTYGDHQDLRELILTNKAKGMQLDVKAGGKVAFSLSHYDETDWCGASGTGQYQLFWHKQHWSDLTKRQQVYAHFDYDQQILGNNSCNGDSVHSNYLYPQTGDYTLRFKPSLIEATTLGNE